MHHRQYYAFLWLLYTLVVYKANANEDCTIANGDEECTSTTNTNSSEDLDRDNDNNNNKSPTLKQLKQLKRCSSLQNPRPLYTSQDWQRLQSIQIVRRRNS